MDLLMVVHKRLGRHGNPNPGRMQTAHVVNMDIFLSEIAASALKLSNIRLREGRGGAAAQLSENSGKVKRLRANMQKNVDERIRLLEECIRETKIANLDYESMELMIDITSALFRGKEYVPEVDLPKFSLDEKNILLNVPKVTECSIEGSLCTYIVRIAVNNTQRLMLSEIFIGGSLYGIFSAGLDIKDYDSGYVITVKYYDKGYISLTLASSKDHEKSMDTVRMLAGELEFLANS
jgi:hypothetical protein